MGEMEYAFIDKDGMERDVLAILKGTLSDFGLDGDEYYSELADEEARRLALSFSESMEKYCHMADTRMIGNFANIREDWDRIPGFVKSDVKPWGRFDDIVRSIDDRTIGAEDLEKFQQWANDWFFTAFGTWAICYNFGSLVSELEYEKEREEAVA